MRTTRKHGRRTGDWVGKGQIMKFLKLIISGELAGIPLAAMICLISSSAGAHDSAAGRAVVEQQAKQEFPGLLDLYKHLHTHPELSFQEEQTSARVADELRKGGYEVTTGIGKHGVVAVLRNGSGPTVLVRTDMDALPVKEQTGLPYASSAMSKDENGKEVPVMHACGHDMNMTCVLGAAKVLAHL